MFDFSKLMEAMNESTGRTGGSTRYTIMKATVDWGYQVVDKSGTKNVFEFFPVDLQGVDSEQEIVERNKVSYQAAREWLVERGLEINFRNPVSAVRVRKHKGTSLNKDTAGWGGDNPFVEITASNLDTNHNGEWLRNPRIDALMSSFGEESVWYSGRVRVAEPMVKFGVEQYVVFGAVPDPTFDRDDPETWTPYNSRYNDGETYANYYDTVVAAFDTKSDAVAWMSENGIEVGGDAEGEPLVEASQIPEAPQGLLNTAGFSTKDWPGIYESIVSAVGVDPNKPLPQFIAKAKAHYQDDWTWEGCELTEQEVVDAVRFAHANMSVAAASF